MSFTDADYSFVATRRPGKAPWRDVSLSLSADASKVAILSAYDSVFDVLSFEDQRLQRVAVARGANVRTLSWSSTGDTLFAASGTRNGAQLLSLALKPALTAMRFAVRRNQDGQIHMTAAQLRHVAGSPDRCPVSCEVEQVLDVPRPVDCEGKERWPSSSPSSFPRNNS